MTWGRGSQPQLLIIPHFVTEQPRLTFSSFILQAKENAMVEVTISEDMREVLFDFYQ